MASTAPAFEKKGDLVEAIESGRYPVYVIIPELAILHPGTHAYVYIYSEVWHRYSWTHVAVRDGRATKVLS